MAEKFTFTDKNGTHTVEGFKWGVQTWHPGDGYEFNNWFGLSAGNRHQLNSLLEYTQKYGYIPDREEIADYLGLDVDSAAVSNLSHDLKKFFDVNGIDYESIGSTSDSSASAQEQAYNEYMRQIYSTDDGTLGGEIYNNLVSAERNNALAQRELAEAQAQQLSMQQAEATKTIADQIRAERISKLRAGMNESQIASQDMQTMMSNMQTLNQQVASTNNAKLQASQQYNLAQDTAYQQWLQNANSMGQVGAAMAAADAGDAITQARAYAAAAHVPFAQAYRFVTGQQSSK